MSGRDQARDTWPSAVLDAVQDAGRRPILLEYFGTQVAASSTVDRVGLQDSTVVLDDRCCAFRQHGVLFVQRRRCCSLRWG